MFYYQRNLKFLLRLLKIHFAFPTAKKRDTLKNSDVKTSPAATEYYATPSGKPSTWLPLEGLVEQIPCNGKHPTRAGIRTDEAQI